MTALRFALVMTRIQADLARRPEVDGSMVQAEVNRIRTALRCVKTVKSKVKEIHKSGDAVLTEIDTFYQEVNDALLAIERALRAVPST
jgi:hypothetical protein